MCNYLKRNNWSFTAKSLLTFELVPIVVDLPQMDVIFFASSRSFEFYVKQREIVNEAIACAGEATAKYIRSRGYEVSYFPIMSGKVTDSAREFASWVGNRVVGFSISDLSKRSYSQFLTKEQMVIIPTYNTLFETDLIPKCDIYVFTSPSNVDAFLAHNTIAEGAKVISWGETTTQHMTAVNIPVNYTLGISSDEALIQVLSQL